MGAAISTFSVPHPRPSCEVPLQPQQSSVPPVAIAHAVVSLSNTPVAEEMLAVTGIVESVFVPLPSSP